MLTDHSFFCVFLLLLLLFLIFNCFQFFPLLSLSLCSIFHKHNDNWLKLKTKDGEEEKRFTLMDKERMNKEWGKKRCMQLLIHTLIDVYDFHNRNLLIFFELFILIRKRRLERFIENIVTKIENVFALTVLWNLGYMKWCYWRSFSLKLSRVNVSKMAIINEFFYSTNHCEHGTYHNVRVIIKSRRPRKRDLPFLRQIISLNRKHF